MNLWVKSTPMFDDPQLGLVELEGDSDGALDYWFKCLGFSYQPETPEHDNWVEMASQRLKPKERKK